MMGILLMTFEFPLTQLFGLFLAVWGATNLIMRATRFACCIKHRRDLISRGETPRPCAVS